MHAIVIERLRLAGHDVEAIAHASPGLDDEAILLRKDIAEWILLTYDRDFGDLIFNRGQARPYAIIYSRLGRADPRNLADKIDLLLSKGLIEHHIHVIDRNKIRTRAFPNEV